MGRDFGVIIRIFGEIAVADGDGWKRAGPAKQSAVLAVLAMSVGRPVDRQSIIDRVWGDTSPQAATSALYAYIARLRKTLAQHPGATIARGDDDGYRLETPPARIDLYAARDLASRATTLAAAGSHERAVTLWTEAEAVVQGEPLANLTGDWADHTRRELHDERLAMVENRFVSELALGRHRQVLAALTDVVDTHPLSSSLTGSLMLALHRSNKPNDAVDLYRRFSARRRHETGTEPGPSLRKLHERIRRNDPSLELGSSSRPAPSHRDAPRQLPPVAGRFIGRSTVIDQLTGILDRGSTSMALVVGMAGVGKTAVAARWGHQVAQRFPDGQLHVDLKGFDTRSPRAAEDVLASFLKGLGVPVARIPDGIDERVALYRSKTDNKRMLVVLDNAADADQVRALLPSGDRCFTLVTSRDALSGLVASEGAQRIRLDVLTHDDAVTLVRHMVGPNPGDIDRLVALCGRLPLALRIAAADLVDDPRRTVAEYIDELCHARFTTLSIAGDPSAAVEPAFDISYHRMPGSARQVFRNLGTPPSGSFTAAAVAALADTDLATANMSLRTMLSANLVESAGPGRYRLHDLLREYAATLSRREDGPQARDEALRRLGHWHAASSRNAAAMLRADHLLLPAEPAARAETFDSRDQAVHWLENEKDVLVPLMRALADLDMSDVVITLADSWRGHLATRSEFDTWRDSATLGLDQANTNADRLAQAAMGRGLGWYHTEKGDDTTAVAHYKTALDAALDADAPPWQAAIRAGIASAHYRVGNLVEAAEACKRAVAETVEPPRAVLNILGITSRELGRLHESVATFEKAVQLNRQDDSANLGIVLGNLAEPYRDLGRLAEARRCAEEATELAEELRSLRRQCHHSDELARIFAETGDWEAAEQAAQQAATLMTTLELTSMRSHVLTTLAIAAGGDPALACERAAAAVQAAQDDDAVPVLIDAWLVQARALRRTGRAAEALAPAEQAREHANRRGYRVQEGKALTELAAVHEALRDMDAARFCAETALVLHRDTGHRPGEARTLRVLARLTGASAADTAADEIFADTGAVDDD